MLLDFPTHTHPAGYYKNAKFLRLATQCHKGNSNLMAYGAAVAAPRIAKKCDSVTGWRR